MLAKGVLVQFCGGVSRHDSTVRGAPSRDTSATMPLPMAALRPLGSTKARCWDSDPHFVPALAATFIGDCIGGNARDAALQRAMNTRKIGGDPHRHGLTAMNKADIGRPHPRRDCQRAALRHHVNKRRPGATALPIVPTSTR